MTRKKKDEKAEKIRKRITVAVNNQKLEYFLDETSLADIQADVSQRLAMMAAKVERECAEAQRVIDRIKYPEGRQLALSEA